MREIDLYEAYKPITNIQQIRAYYSPMINKVLKDKNNALYRGVNLSTDKMVVMTPRKTPRKAAYAAMNIHNSMINDGVFGELPRRDIIMSSDKDYTKNYGNTFVCFPHEGAMIGSVGDKDIFEAFPNIIGHELDDYYSIILSLIDEVSEIIKEVGGKPLELDYINNVKDLSRVFKSWKGYDLIKHADGLSGFLDIPEKFVTDIFETLSVKPITDLMMDNTLSQSLLDDLSVQPNTEYWTDALTLMIPYEQLDEFLDKIRKYDEDNK